MNSLWDILSVAIGISFIFMILSILNSWVQDYIATVFHLRANNLADIIQNLLEPGAEQLNGRTRALDDLFPVLADDPGPGEEARKKHKWAKDRPGEQDCISSIHREK
jgi:hypothetical protein